MPIYEYECEDYHLMDVVTSYKNRKEVMPCKVCGKPSTLLVSMPLIALDAISGDFPGASNKFETEHIQRAAREKKKYQEE